MKYLNFIFLFLCVSSIAQTDNLTFEELIITPLIDGTLLIPNPEKQGVLAIIIADSGPTDRNGNQPMMKNNSLRFLAEDLYKQGIATFRYDKRIVKQMKKGKVAEKNIRFDDFGI